MYIGAKQDGSVFKTSHIAEYFEMPYNSVRYHVKKIQQEGLIDSLFTLTDKGSKLFQFLWRNQDTSRLRAHNIQIKFKVVKCPANFPECFSKSIYQPLTNNKYKGIMAELKGMTVMFYSPNKIVCVLRDIYANNDEEISSALQVVIPSLKEILECEFKGIKLDNHELAKIQTQHIAVLNSTIARKYLLNGFTEENNNFAIDNSNGVPEIELTNPSTALRDIMDLLGLEDKFKEKQDKTEGIDKQNKQSNSDN